MPTAAHAARVRAPDAPPANLAVLDPAGVRAVADAINRLADVGERAIAAATPAAETVHGFAARLDALCLWLKSKRPWMAGIAIMALLRLVNVAPDEATKLVDALATFAKVLSGQ